MAKLSAGLLVFRVSSDRAVDVIIVHPGGPFWAKKDLGAWSIPKGEYEEGEDPYGVALREFEEEIGISPPAGAPIELGELKQPSGKRLSAWAVECEDFDLTETRSNTFEMEWPRGSGQIQVFPEVDRAAWFSVAEARERLLKGHVAFLDLLMSSVQGTEGQTSSSKPQTQGELF